MTITTSLQLLLLLLIIIMIVMVMSSSALSDVVYRNLDNHRILERTASVHNGARNDDIIYAVTSSTSTCPSYDVSLADVCLRAAAGHHSDAFILPVLRLLTTYDRPLQSSDHIEFSGDFRPCSAEDNDEDCDVISGSGEVDVTAIRQSTDGDRGTWPTAGHHSFIYVERTSPQPEVTSHDGGHVTTSGESLVIVVEMTERSPSRHAGRPLNPTAPPSTTRRAPPYRLLTTTPASVGDDRAPAAAERVAINVGLIVGIVGAVSTLVVMLAALLLCRPRAHVAQSSSSGGVEVDVVNDRKLRLSSTLTGDHELHRARHNVVLHATSLARAHSPTTFQSSSPACSTGARLSTADEWFV